MIALLDTNDDLLEAQAELGCNAEQLLTPLTRRVRQQPHANFAIDNGGFAGVNVPLFKNLLQREIEAQKLCRFVAVPDIVGSARRTLELFDHWRYRMGTWPLALVAQDGQEDLEIPWNGIVAIFIGGTTSWKLSKSAADIVKTAKILGKWVHAGRINTPGRYEYFEELGADSIDGTGLSRYTWMRKEIHEKAIKPQLFPKGSDGVQLAQIA